MVIYGANVSAIINKSAQDVFFYLVFIPPKATINDKRKYLDGSLED